MLSATHVDLSSPIDDRARTLRSVLLLGSLACILFVDALFSAFVLAQAPGRMAEPSAALIPAVPLWSLLVSLPLPVPRQGHLMALALLVTSAVKFAAYALAVYVAWKQPCDRPRLLLVVGAAILFFLVAASALPNVNRDIFNYILSGRVAAVYGANPYLVPPDRFPDDPIYQYANQRYTYYAGDNKLAAWTLINIVLASLGGDSPIANLLLYRLTFTLFNIANLALLVRILRDVRPRRVLAGLVLYGWNPIVITHGQSKVDTVMVFFLLLAALALVRGRSKLAVVALGVSAFVKLITLPLVAVYLLYELRSRGPRAVAASLLLIGLTAAALLTPFWYGPDVLSMQLGLLGNAGSSSPDLFRILAWGGFAIAVLWIGLRQSGRIEDLLFGWALVMVLFGLFLTKLSFSWYLMTLIALASLAVERRLALITIFLSFVTFLVNAWDSASNQVFRLPDLFALPRFVVYLLFVCAAALGLAALELAQKTRQDKFLEIGD